MKTICLAENALDPSTWEKFEAEDVRAFLAERYASFPANARIYHQEVATVCDVTPGNEQEIERLGELPGPFIVVCYPGDPVTLIIAAIAVITIAIAVAVYFLIPNVAKPNTATPSANNQLSERTNQARPLARIPEIVGTVRATPDLLQAPYRWFDANDVEYESSYLCVGRGSYLISDIRDGETLFANIYGENLGIYAPNTSPNSVGGAAPIATIGSYTAQPVMTVQKESGVNGQTLYGPNYKTALPADTSGNVNFQYPNIINSIDGNFKLSRYFSAGDIISITTTTYTSGGFSANLTGVYVVAAVASNAQMTLVSPASINSAWNTLNSFSGHATGSSGAPTLDASNLFDVFGNPTKWVGPFTVGYADMSQIMFNLVASAGLYETDGSGKNSAYPVTITIGVTPLDSTPSHSPTGAEVIYTYTMPGSGSSLSLQALSETITTGNYVSVRALRTTNHDLITNGQIVDAVQWRDLYAASALPAGDFGDVTTIQCVTTCTPAALGVKDRKLNMQVTRKLPEYLGSNTFGPLAPFDSADMIILFLCLDAYNGNRPVSEVDCDGIIATIAAVQAYFGTVEAGEFGYTFDNYNITFEEMIATIANAVFCTAYRQGNKIQLSFERSNPNSSLLFNHRNKIPNSETRQVRFGTLNDVDGIEYAYVDETNFDIPMTYYIPENRSAVNPIKIQSVGVRNFKHAYLQAYRTYNKLIYQNISTDFTATQEADLLVKNDRILVADNTRTDTQDGEIIAQNVLQLTLSQPFKYASLNHSIFLQMIDGTMQSIPIASADPSPASNIVLSVPPRLALALASGLYANTTYLIAGNSDARSAAFLVDSKAPQGNMTTQITAINYDRKYYANDPAFANGKTDFSAFVPGYRQFSPLFILLFR